MSIRDTLIDAEVIFSLASRVGHHKFLKRQNDFVFWLNSFISSAKSKGILKNNDRLMQNMEVKEMALYLNYHYWNIIEHFVKKHLQEGHSEPKRVNHYKIAATIEFIVMTYLPFENEDNLPLPAANVGLAFHISLQILFAWNLEKDNITSTVIKELLMNNKPTKDFIEEHKTWLQHHANSSQFVIFSNMQTMRLFHYWFREPKEEGFIPH